MLCMFCKNSLITFGMHHVFKLFSTISETYLLFCLAIGEIYLLILTFWKILQTIFGGFNDKSYHSFCY